MTTGRPILRLKIGSINLIVDIKVTNILGYLLLII